MITINDNNYVQSECKLIGAEGCYFIAIVKGVEHFLWRVYGIVITPNIINIYENAVKFGFMGKDCFVMNPVAIVNLVLGVKPEFAKTEKYCHFEKKDGIDYQAKQNELEITRYENKKTCITYSHFVETIDSKVVYDPYGNSNTVAEGQPVSKRIFTFNMEMLKKWVEQL